MNLQQNERGVYLGMFSVEPELQGAGIGKQLLQAADAHSRKIGASHIYMYVISVREELINWYKRYGFVETGEQFPFAEDGLTGKHLQSLEFIVLEKVLD
jgi:ribosomal protein S18 acetylase RimI-like enzyme